MRIVFITTPPDDADAMARTLVEERLAACVNVLPGVTSHYRWQGTLESDPETLLIAKVRADGLDAFTARVLELHPADVPEILAVEPTGGNARYIDWVLRGE